jgi:putative oxidoreductase
VHSATMLVGGLGLATGKAPRACALALAATLLPTTYTAHPFWAASGAERAHQRVQFLKNTSVLGGLLLAAVDTEGKDSLARRTRRAKRRAQREAKAARLEAALRAERAKRGLDRALPS